MALPDRPDLNDVADKAGCPKAWADQFVERGRQQAIDDLDVARPSARTGLGPNSQAGYLDRWKKSR